MNKKVMWDLDNVICALTESAFRHHHSQGRLLEYRMEDVADFNWSNLPIELAEVWAAYNHRDPLYTADHYPAALKAIRYLQGLGDPDVEQAIVTGRPSSPESRRLTEHWLRQRGIDLPLHFVSAGDKADWCIEHGFRWAIEDHWETAVEMACSGIGVCLVAFPWNETNNVPYRRWELLDKKEQEHVCNRVRRFPHPILTPYVVTIIHDPDLLRCEPDIKGRLEFGRISGTKSLA